ncbi:MAG: MarR family transcriptional regulator [Pseudomonadota bacterium]
MSDDFDLEMFLPYLLNQAAEAKSRAFQKIYRDRYGILRSEWRVVFHLGLYGQMTARDICDRAQMHKTKISRAVQRLESKRLIRRARDTSDRRVEHLSLTASGRRIYEDLRTTAKAYEADMLGAFSTKEIATLRSMLVTLANTRSVRA